MATMSQMLLSLTSMSPLLRTWFGSSLVMACWAWDGSVRIGTARMARRARDGLVRIGTGRGGFLTLDLGGG
jgi:hypothetical protein